ncbi:von Willebrand factor A domain-containing protein 7-like [Saccostrea echinata]|uniref:von Willebrand factor A domain-containing protein 7-like n=1 Tax=Saccostrea echinata TaxID=191078 RepID=UPI002A83256A|nr:von Willebrand factor A domain-containing protein 7-like [Saccostrea echinata]
MAMKTVLFLVLVARSAFSFLPTQESTKHGDFSHQSITERALYESAATFIWKYIDAGTGSTKQTSRSAVNATIEFFRGDRSSEAVFGRVVETIVWGNNKAQEMYANIPMRTMNAELIFAGNLLLQSMREQIIVLSQSPTPDWNNIRKLIGEYLFTLQMFYSNTNWVETHGNLTCSELGIRGRTLMPTAPPNVATCAGCPYSHPQIDKHSCQNNILVNGQYLTSGYLSTQGIPKPTGNNTAGMGKCSHGGKNDAFSAVNPIGGINKETSDSNLSPHFYLHHTAGEAAVDATMKFFVGEVTGLLDQIGPRLFGELIGLPVACKDCLKPGLSLAYVIDTSLSMSTDFEEIKTKVTETIQSALLENKTTPSDFILSTFSDPVSLNTIRNTTDGYEMISWIRNLKQEGGGDCPEYSFGGLLEALKIIKPGSCLFFYSDADPKDSQLERVILQIASQKDIHIAFLVKGTCNSGIPFYDRLENATKATCLKQSLDKGRRKRDANELVIHQPWKKLSSFQNPGQQRDPDSSLLSTLLPASAGVIGLVLVLAVLLRKRQISSEEKQTWTELNDRHHRVSQT